ncbi:MAG: hypothetical protein KF767_06245 [Bdellovibrionaceae bacterium]|nr:hypothetical protein [Pseudobdellovibrionaceae bacterium]
MKSVLTLIALLLVAATSHARANVQFRCVAVSGKSIKFYTTVWSEYDRMKVKYTDSYYGNGGNYEPDLDRQFEIRKDGAKYVADVPGLGNDKMQLVIDTTQSARLSGGKEWGSRSRVHPATFQIGDGKPAAIVCEVAY